MSRFNVAKVNSQKYSLGSIPQYLTSLSIINSIFSYDMQSSSN